MCVCVSISPGRTVTSGPKLMTEAPAGAVPPSRTLSILFPVITILTLCRSSPEVPSIRLAAWITTAFLGEACFCWLKRAVLNKANKARATTGRDNEVPPGNAKIKRNMNTLPFANMQCPDRRWDWREPKDLFSGLAARNGALRPKMRRFLGLEPKPAPPESDSLGGYKSCNRFTILEIKSKESNVIITATNSDI